MNGRVLALSRQLFQACLVTVPNQNTLLAERREPSGIEEPESLRSSATIEIGKLFRDCSLDNSAMGTQRRQVAGRIQEPEPFPFIDDHSQIFAGEQQLLNATLGSSGIDWQKATDRSRKANGQSDQLQGSAHRGFLHERERQCCQRSVTIETL